MKKNELLKLLENRKKEYEGNEASYSRSFRFSLSEINWMLGAVNMMLVRLDEREKRKEDSSVG